MDRRDMPVACMLTGGSYRERVHWLEQLSRDGLVRRERDDLKLTLTYQECVRDRVLRMVAQEQQCCPFLEFDVREVAAGIQVTIAAPEQARSTADSLFDPFITPQISATRSTPTTAEDCGAAPRRGQPLERPRSVTV